MGDITENFSRYEFACKCGCGKDDIHVGLVHRLQVIRDITGHPIRILSGCRCQKHNAEVKGTQNSYHLYGMAADWCFGGEETDRLLEKVATKLIPEWSGGFHYYPDKGFIHCDIGPKRRW